MYNTALPVYYDYVNAYDSVIQPSTIHVHDTALARYFKRYLLDIAISVFKWRIPANWQKEYFLYCLYCLGHVAVINTDRYGVIPQNCNLSGYGIFYQPTTVLISNPLLQGMRELRIGVNTELIKLNLDYCGIMDLINYYGDIMALCAESCGTNLLNTKLAYIFAASSKAGAESFKNIYDRIASGEGVATYDKALLDDNGKLNFQMFNQNLKQTYITSDIINDLKKYEQEFLTKVGIPNGNTYKSERMITGEINANNVETRALSSLWLDNINDCLTKVNDMFNLDISVEFRFKNSTGFTAEESGGDLVNAS